MKKEGLSAPLTPEWYRLRTALFESQEVRDDIASCNHPDAVLLTRVFEGNHHFNLYDMFRHPNPVVRIYGTYGLRKSDPAFLATQHVNTEDWPTDHSLGLLFRKKFKDAAEAGEPNACIKMARGRQRTDAAHWYKKGAMMGHVDCMFYYSSCCSGCAERYEWLERAMLIDKTSVAMVNVVLLTEDHGWANFALGRVLKRNNLGIKTKSVEIYTTAITAARTATLTAILCLQRLRMAKDTARLIGRLVFSDFESFLK